MALDEAQQLGRSLSDHVTTSQLQHEQVTGDGWDLTRRSSSMRLSTARSVFAGRPPELSTLQEFVQGRLGVQELLLHLLGQRSGVDP